MTTDQAHRFARYVTPYGWNREHEADQSELGVRVANALCWENRKRRPVLLGVVRAGRGQ